MCARVRDGPQAGRRVDAEPRDLPGEDVRPDGPPDAAAPPGAAQFKPALAQGPGDLVHAAFVDERHAFADGGAPQAGLRYARIRRGRPEPSRRLDSPGPRPLAARLDNSWAPSAAAREDRVLVAWLDFRNYDWDVFSRESGDGGTNCAERQVNDTPSDPGAGDGENEALNDAPRAAFATNAPLVAFTDWRKRASAETQPHLLYDTYVAAPGARNHQVDQHGDHRCTRCGTTKQLEVHHLVPVAEGGGMDIDRLTVLCAPCHHAQH